MNINICKKCLKGKKVKYKLLRDKDILREEPDILHAYVYFLINNSEYIGELSCHMYCKFDKTIKSFKRVPPDNFKQCKFYTQQMIDFYKDKKDEDKKL